MTKPQATRPPVLVIGGAGFVGCNLADRLARAGHPVRVFDNLSRAGVRTNAAWLERSHPERVQLEVADLRDRDAVREAVQGVAAVYHLAAQVAVTTSLEAPLHDFEVNLRGTVNVLEALRALGDEAPPLIFTSTNKVYGCLPDVPLDELERRYRPSNELLARTGIDEERPLEFRSPYGCSKGAADQYVLDYAKTFGLRTAVFRMSCIYGPHQFGNEDQGWVAHFLIQALRRQPITVYGDGKQVRDVLFVDDLVAALLEVWARIDALGGRAFNIGGGVGNAISLLDLLDMIAELEGEAPEVRHEGWRPGDQRYYVSDTRAFQEATGWRARVDVHEGVRRLRDWLEAAGRGAEPAPSGAEPLSLPYQAGGVKHV